jgi:hypothetical protein
MKKYEAMGLQTHPRIIPGDMTVPGGPSFDCTDTSPSSVLWWMHSVLSDAQRSNNFELLRLESMETFLTERTEMVVHALLCTFNLEYRRRKEGLGNSMLIAAYACPGRSDDEQFRDQLKAQYIQDSQIVFKKLKEYDDALRMCINHTVCLSSDVDIYAHKPDAAEFPRSIFVDRQGVSSMPFDNLCELTIVKHLGFRRDATLHTPLLPQQTRWLPPVSVNGVVPYEHVVMCHFLEEYSTLVQEYRTRMEFVTQGADEIYLNVMEITERALRKGSILEPLLMLGRFALNSEICQAVSVELREIERLRTLYTKLCIVAELIYVCAGVCIESHVGGGSLPFFEVDTTMIRPNPDNSDTGYDILYKGNALYMAILTCVGEKALRKFFK